VEILVEGAVEPGNPDHPEYDGELAEATPRDMLGERVSGPGDDHDVHQVVEELEEAHRAVFDDVAMGARWQPESGLEA